MVIDKIPHRENLDNYTLKDYINTSYAVISDELIKEYKKNIPDNANIEFLNEMRLLVKDISNICVNRNRY